MARRGGGVGARRRGAAARGGTGDGATLPSSAALLRLTPLRPPDSSRIPLPCPRSYRVCVCSLTHASPLASQVQLLALLLPACLQSAREEEPSAALSEADGTRLCLSIYEELLATPAHGGRPLVCEVR